MKQEALRILNDREKDTLRAVLVGLVPTVEQVVKAYDMAMKFNNSMDSLRDKIDPPTKRKK
jgi:hypothetical protein